MSTLTSMIPGAFAPVHETPIAGRNFIGFMYLAACSSTRVHAFQIPGSGGNHEVSQSILRRRGSSYNRARSVFCERIAPFPRELQILDNAMQAFFDGVWGLDCANLHTASDSRN